MTEIFVVATEPAPLAGMAFPDPPADWTALHAAGYRRVLQLHRGDYDSSPRLVHGVELEDLYGGLLTSLAALRGYGQFLVGTGRRWG